MAISRHWIWLGSKGQGVTLINRSTQQSLTFNQATGLSNNFITNIVIDSVENAWVSTNQGISVINPKLKTVKSYHQNEQIFDNEFISDSALISREEIIYFGGLNGFHAFSPREALKASQTLPTPVISSILLANKYLRVSAKKTKEFSLQQSANTLKQLTLNHKQSQFSLEFISANVKMPSHLKYRYRLIGLEDNWIDAGKNNLRATYTNLSAGDYTFEVQAYDLQNKQESAIKALNISIIPPWWMSRVAIWLYSLIILLIIAYIVQQARHKRRYHRQIKLSEERLKLSLWGSGDEMWDWNIKQNKIYRANTWGILEFPQDGKRNIAAQKANIHQQDIARVQQALNQHFADSKQHFEVTYRVKSKNNKWLWVLDRGKIVERDEANNPSRMTGTLKDISQIKRTDERLKLFAKCIENISDAIVIYDRKFTVVDVNKAFQRITGKNKLQIRGTLLTFDQYPDSFSQIVKKHLMTQGSWHGEIESLHDNGSAYLADLNIDVIRNENNSISHFVAYFLILPNVKKMKLN